MCTDRDPDCRCRKAVLQAYGILSRVGQPERTALEAAIHVYSHHHPEDSRRTARLTVERWVNRDRLH